MHDLSRLPVVTPDVLLASGPPPAPRGPVRFLLGDAPVRDQPALLRDCFARMRVNFEVTPLSDVPFEVDFAMNALPGLVMASGQLQGSRVSRTRAHVEEDNSDDIALMMARNGSQIVSQRGSEVELRDGDAVLISCADPASYAHPPPGDIVALRLPKSRFAPLVNGVQDRFMKKVPRDVPALRFLISYLGTAWDEQTCASPELRHLVVTHVYDLMALMFGATREAANTAHGRGLHAARLHAIKRDIAENLGRPDLSITTLAGRHACTPRFIQRLFDDEGTTFTEYVLAQRLARAYRLLTDPRRATEKISTAAFDAGFGDVSYFNRVFRRQYGAAPSEIRARTREAGSEA